MTTEQLDQLSINTIRTLSMDAVQAAKSGHPGTPMSLAPLAYVMWNRDMRFDPTDTHWPNRDRFILSNGHASMLVWSVLHLTGTQTTTGEPAITIDDIKKFRQLHSRAAGHPEYGMVSGVECTTGPLGQGVAMSVGMAIAEKWLESRYNKPNHTIYDYKIFAVCGDGCLMEGVSSEAASLAGHLKLDNLCWIFDNNHITIEGRTSITFTEDVGARFLAYGWNVLHVTDANDLTAIQSALTTFRKTTGKPTIIILDSLIGWGAPHKQDTPEAHGEPLGDEEIRLTKRGYGWPEDAKFLVPEGVREHFDAGIGARGKKANAEWKASFAAYRTAFPELAGEIDLMQKHALPTGWDKDLPTFAADAAGMAGREASNKVLLAIAQSVPWMIGGSADLGSSNKTFLKYTGYTGSFQPENYAGRTIHFGVREHAMAAIVNGMTLSKLRAFGATFFVFSDYARPAIRMAAVMEVPSLMVFTHEALSDGEDGPTHQAIEHLMSLRAMPNIVVLRPADANEVVEAYRYIFTLQKEPAVLALTRHAVPTIDRTKYASAAGLQKGAYVLADAPDGKPEVIIIASGSEVILAVQAHEELLKSGVKSRVVSMPSWGLFEHQTQEYRDSVLPPSVLARVAVEQGATLGWERYVGMNGKVVGMRTFGASAPLKALEKFFGFDAEHVIAAVKTVLGKV